MTAGMITTLVAVFFYQVAYGTNEASYKIGYLYGQLVWYGAKLVNPIHNPPFTNFWYADCLIYRCKLCVGKRNS
jgi:hypothetical protein